MSTFSTISLPAGEKLHDIMALMNFDASKLCGETLGATSVRKHQEILQKHWSSGEVATLPGEDIQRCLLGVSILLSILLKVMSFFCFLIGPSFITSLEFDLAMAIAFLLSRI